MLIRSGKEGNSVSVLCHCKSYLIEVCNIWEEKGGRQGNSERESERDVGRERERERVWNHFRKAVVHEIV